MINQRKTSSLIGTVRYRAAGIRTWSSLRWSAASIINDNDRSIMKITWLYPLKNCRLNRHANNMFKPSALPLYWRNMLSFKWLINKLSPIFHITWGCGYKAAMAQKTPQSVVDDVKTGVANKTQYTQQIDCRINRGGENSVPCRVRPAILLTKLMKCLSHGCELMKNVHDLLAVLALIQSNFTVPGVLQQATINDKRQQQRFGSSYIGLIYSTKDITHQDSWYPITQHPVWPILRRRKELASILLAQHQQLSYRHTGLAERRTWPQVTRHYRCFHCSRAGGMVIMGVLPARHGER